MNSNKVNNTSRGKKNNVKIKQEENKRGKSKKVFDENSNNIKFEKYDNFLSEQNDENIKINNNRRGKIIKNPILSPSKPDKNKNIIFNDFHSEARGSIPKKFNLKKNDNNNFDICIPIDKYNENIPSYQYTRSNTRKKISAIVQKEIKELKNNLVPKSHNKDKAKQKDTSKIEKERKNSKNVNKCTAICQYTNMFDINNINNIKQERGKTRRNTGSYATRKNNNIIDDTVSVRTIKNKEMKKKEKEKKKVKKERRKRGAKEHKKDNNATTRQGKSKSHTSNSIREKIKEEEKNNEIRKRNKRDYSSPRNLNSKNYIDNSLSLKNKMIKREDSNSIKKISPQKTFNYKKVINNKLSLLDDYTYSNPKIDMKKFTITLKKHLIKNNAKNPKKKDLLQKSRSNINVNMLGKKRKRNPSVQSKNIKKEDNNTPPRTYKKIKNEEEKDKSEVIIKGKSHKVTFKVEKDALNENSHNEHTKLKNDVNIERKKAKNNVKKNTQRTKSVKKKQKKKEFETVNQELNSVDSFSEPDKNIYDQDYYNIGNNNYKLNNFNNAQNIQYQQENPQTDFFQKKSNSLLYSLRNSNDINCPNSLPNYKSNDSQNKYKSYNNNTNIKPFCLNFDNPINANNMLSSNSFHELPSETANFICSHSNSLEYSFPLDFEEKIDIKEDKTYFAKTSKYIKYCPIDEYIPPICNEEKKPYRSRIAINHTRKLEFPKKKENKPNSFESDNDKTDITSTNNDYVNDLPSILKIPRIKPYKEEHSKMIKDKLIQDGIKIYKNDNENILKEEKSLYIGSFVLYDEKNNIKVNVPCYKENEETKEFMNRKKLNIIEFQEDNDIETDEEQLELEIDRNNTALLNFMRKVSKNKNYVEDNLVRKKKV